MTFSFCPSSLPQYHPATARRLAAEASGFAEAFPCPLNEGDHAHVAYREDEPLLERWRARVERRRQRAAAVNRERSEAMGSGIGRCVLFAVEGSDKSRCLSWHAVIDERS